MTGFGRAEGKIKGGTLRIEIKSVNHRFLEVAGRIPPELLIYEEEIKKYLKKKILRGSLSLNFSYAKEGIDEKSVTVDRKLARRYFNFTRGLGRELGLKDDVGIKDILAFPGVVVYAEAKEDLSRDWNACKKVLEKAAEKLLLTKVREGKGLLNDILSRIALIEKATQQIEQRARKVIQQYKYRLKGRLKHLLGSIEKERLGEEAIIFARNADISEELMRTKSHLAHVRHMLKTEDEVGRKLDFVAQELYRETNTIGAKGNDYLISKEVVIIKAEIEKIREQVQNIE